MQRIEENKRRAQKLRAKRKALINDLCSTNLMTKEALIEEQKANVISATLESGNQNIDSGQPGFATDVMMDDNEALQYIFSSA